MKIKNLYFRHHHQGPYFFQDLSFELEKGRIHALHGKNGIGKSVLFHLLTRQIEPEAFLSGDISEETAVLVSQQFDQTLIGEFSFLENLKLSSLSKFPSPFARFKLSGIPKQFSEILRRFHIDVTIPVCKLSGGQRQILALLMKLQKNPSLLLLDEPTATLDEQNAVMVFDFLQSLEGVTMLIVCHDRELITRYVTGKHFLLEMAPSGSRQLKELVEGFL